MCSPMYLATNPSYRLWSWFRIALLVGVLAACGGTATTETEQQAGADPADSVVLRDIQISLENERVVHGLSSQAYAAGLYSNNDSADLSAAVQWSSSDSTVATVNAAGEITGLQVGSTLIAATKDGLTASANLVVDEAALLALSIHPQNRQLAAGLTQQFSALGEFNNGDSYDVTELVSWQSSDANVITIAENSGLVQAVASGSASISASVGAITTTTLVTVSEASLSGIEISADQTQLPTGTKLTLVATGIFSDHSVMDLSAQVNWQSSDEAVASIDALGQVSAISTGTTQISLSHLGQSASLDITAIDAALVAVEISPASPGIIQNDHLQLYATARYSDGTSLDVTKQVTWLSSDETVLVVGNSALDRGEAQGLAPGAATVTAYFEGEQQDVDITVSEASLTNTEITPIESNLAVGTRQRFSVTGHYDDGSSRDITEQVQWSIIDSSIANSDTAGVFKAAAVGSSQVIATLDKVVAFAVLDVSAATLDRIEISPLDIGIAAGYQTQLTAMGHFSDNSSQDISDSVLWQSSTPAAASISNADGRQGLLTAVAAGTSTISVRHDSVSSEALVTVSAATLDSITIQTTSTEMTVGHSQTLTALGHYSDDSVLDLSDAVTWSSSNESSAAVSNAKVEKGLVTALSEGPVTITAGIDGVNASVNLDLSADPNAVVSLSLSAAPNVILSNGADASTITFKLQPAASDGQVADNTPIEIEIIEGDHHSLQTIYSSNGQASVDLSSTHDGYIEIRARLANGISSSAHLFSSDDFANVIARVGLVSVQYENDTLLAGSWFGLLMKNLSNRDFDLEQYEFSNGLNSNTFPVADINDGQLGAGEQGTVLVTLADDQLDEGLTGVMSLSDPGTAQTFSITTQFTQP